MQRQIWNYFPAPAFVFFWTFLLAFLSDFILNAIIGIPQWITQIVFGIFPASWMVYMLFWAGAFRRRQYEGTHIGYVVDVSRPVNERKLGPLHLKGRKGEIIIVNGTPKLSTLGLKTKEGEWYRQLGIFRTWSPPQFKIGQRVQVNFKERGKIESIFPA